MLLSIDLTLFKPNQLTSNYVTMQVCFIMLKVYFWNHPKETINLHSSHRTYITIKSLSSNPKIRIHLIPMRKAKQPQIILLIPNAKQKLCVFYKTCYET